MKGIEAIREAWTLWTAAFDELRVDVSEWTDAGDAVIAAAHWQGRGRPAVCPLTCVNSTSSSSEEDRSFERLSASSPSRRPRSRRAVGVGQADVRVQLAAALGWLWENPELEVPIRPSVRSCRGN